MLGIFDSGLGGLTVLRHVRARLPHEDVVYLADQAHVPYGNRDEDDLARLMAVNVGYLDDAGVDAIVMGCNTSCAVAARRGWPRSRAPILDLIAAATDAAVATGARRIGVLATAATARSGAYGAALRALSPDVLVQEVAAPKLVPLVESGVLSGPVARAAVAESVARFTLPLDVVILACTHYPLLASEIRSSLRGVPLLDPADAQARRAVAFAAASAPDARGGRLRFVTTGALAPYRAAVQAILGPAATGATYETAAAVARRA